MSGLGNNVKMQGAVLPPVKSPGINAFGWVLALAGSFSGATFSDSVYAKVAAEPDAKIVTEARRTVADTKILKVSVLVDQVPSVNPSPNQEEVPVATEEAASEVLQPQVVASLGNSILEHGDSGSTIDASTVLERSNGSVLSVPETELEPTEPGEHIVTSAEEMLPARGVSHFQAQGPGTSVVVTNNIPARQPPTSSEDGAGLPYAIILALFALISLIPVARRNDDHHHV